MLIYGWLETREQKHPLLTPPCFLPHIQAFQISLATRIPKGTGITLGEPPAVGIHAAGDFFAWIEPEGYVDGKGRAWYSGIAFCMCLGMIPGKGGFYAN